MSKYVKQLQVNDLKRKLKGVNEAVVVNMVGVDSAGTAAIRDGLAKKGIRVLVVKNTLAKLVLGEGELAPAAQYLTGSSAIAFGGENISQLAKELIEQQKKQTKLTFRGACVQGSGYGGDKIEEISRLPTREDMLAKVAQLIMSPGANLAAAILGPGGTLAGQIKQKSEGAEESAPAA